jgi:competence protein ComEA
MGVAIEPPHALADQPTKVSINKADSSQLESLPGIGLVTAGKIISQRPYSSIDELVVKKVIGQSVFSKIKELIIL